MIEFFIGLLLYTEPGKPTQYDLMPFRTELECKQAVRAVEAALAAEAPEGTDIRLSCISTESLGQNSV